MSHSTIIHSSLVNPAKPKLVKENNADSVDTVTLDVPLLTRIMELSREDLKSDEDLHVVLTNILSLKNKGVLTMQDYDSIVIKQQEPTHDEVELESIKKLAGI